MPPHRSSDQVLELERSGGFAGLTLRASVPLSELTEEQLAALEECLSQTPRRNPRAGPGAPDRFQYRLRLGEREAVLPEDALPSALRPLLGRLEFLP
jgi:hypothetical protein